MVTKTKIAGLMMVLMALSAPMVYADNGGGSGDSWHQDEGHHGKEIYMLSKIINLSDDQVKQLKGIREKQKTAMKGLFEQMKTQRVAFNEEIVKATPDMNKINDIQTQIKALQSQMLDNHLNSFMEIKKIMTTEQFAGYMALKKERTMMKHMRGDGKFGHGDGFGKGEEHHDSDD